MSVSSPPASKVAPIGERERLLAFSFANADVLLEVDADLRITYASGAARSLVGVPGDQLMGAGFLTLIAPKDRLYVGNLIASLGQNARLEAVQVQVQGRADRPRHALLAGYRMDDAERHYFLTLTKARLSASEQAAQNRADVDSGLLSADDFADLVADRSLEASKIDEKVQLTMLQLDRLEQFKGQIGANNAGRLMAEVGAMLRSVSVGGRSAGRLGNDRFGILHDGKVEAAAIRRRLEAISVTCDPQGRGVPVADTTIDVLGTELAPDEAAKVVVYAIKRFAEAGDKEFSVESLNDGIQEMLSDAINRVATLKETVANRRIEVALQPIVGLGGRELHHYEALCRPMDGQSPATFVGFAEEVGLVGDFDLMICQKVIDLMLQAERDGGLPHIAVNLSAGSVENEGFVQAFRELLGPHRHLRPRLLIEVTESTQIKNLPMAENVLQQFRRDGHKVCLDDFGAGAAAFQYIQALTVDFVKIDGAYVRRMLGDGRDEAILKAMAGLCRDLKVGTIAEMIETEAQEQRLQALGVDFGQGYLFGKPKFDYPLGKALEPADAAAIMPFRKVASNLRRRGAVESWG